jgi:hypothetical protein
MTSNKQQLSKSLSWKTILISAVLAFFMAFSFYLLFLQPPHVISKTRLIIALGLWVVFFIGLTTIITLDLLKIRGEAPRVLLLAICISLSFSTVFFHFGFHLNDLPYNLLILPKHTVEIQPVCENGKTQIVELKYFIDGLDVVSYSAFEKQGNWERTIDSFRTDDCSQANLRYNGWLDGQPTIAFKTQPNGGRVIVNWDGTQVTADLSSISIGQIILSKDVGIDQGNKISVLLTFFISFAVLLFPLANLFARDIISPKHTSPLKSWFEETTANLQPLILIVLILSFLASIGLFSTILLEQDNTPVEPANAAITEQPNIILIIVDSFSAQDMSLFGYSLPTTPNLERETRDWTIYTNANTSATCTIGIFPSLVTGHYPYFSYPFSRYGEEISASPDWVNLLGMMARAGYTNYWNSYYILPNIYHAAQGINDFLFYPFPNPLFRTWFQSNSFRQTTFPHYPLILQLANPLFQQSSSNKSPQIIGDMFVQGKIQSPFFIYMHYRGSHFGSYYSGKYLGSFLPIEEGVTGYYEQNELLGAYPVEKQSLVDKLHLRYDEAILHEDDSLGQLIEKIKQAGLYDSSLIIITGDHGQVFDNGYVAHCTPLVSYSETHIPILVKYPHQTQGERIHSMISIIDITPTILDIANIKYEENWFDGISLLHNNPLETTRQYIFIRNLNDESDIKTPSFAVMNERYKLALRKDGYFLYDYLKDPNEKYNMIADTSIDPLLIKSMQQALDAYIKKTK